MLARGSGGGVVEMERATGMLAETEQMPARRRSPMMSSVHRDDALPGRSNARTEAVSDVAEAFGCGPAIGYPERWNALGELLLVNSDGRVSKNRSTLRMRLGRDQA